MELASARDLKAELTDQVIRPIVETFAARPPVDTVTQPINQAGGAHKAIALGIVRRSPKDFHLAVRIQRDSLQTGQHVDTITKRAKGKVAIIHRRLSV
jgi:hypothetical protein